MPPPAGAPAGNVAAFVALHPAGDPPFGRSAAEIAAMVRAVPRCFAEDAARGEWGWLDDLHALAEPAPATAAAAAARRAVEIPPEAGDGGGAVVVLRLPAGDHVALELRPGGLWIERLPRPPRPGR